MGRSIRTSARYKLRTGEREPVYLEELEIERILEFSRKNAPKGVQHGIERNTALLVVGIDAGLRVRELHLLDWEDVDLEARWLHVQRGKGGKYRRVPLTQESTEALATYKDLTGESSGPVFTSRLGKRLAVRTIQWIVETYGERAGIRKIVDGRQKKLSPHKLRHTFGTRLANHDVQQVKIQKLMGHASRVTTDKYVHAVGTHADVEKKQIDDDNRLERLEDKFDILLDVLMKKKD